MQTITFRAMGCKILIALDTNDANVIEQMQQARSWFEEWEQVFSRFRYTSELTRLNEYAGSPVSVSETMWEVLALAAKTREQTDGLVDPLTLNALESAGYDTSFELLAENRENWTHLPLFALSSIDASLVLDDAHHKVTIPPDHRIDLGGVAKGWAAHQTMLRLQHLAPTLVSAGGDIAISEPQQGNAAWPIGISNPFNVDHDLAILMLAKGGVATSGRDYRRWRRLGQWHHHLIDPRTGMPAETDILSATVIGMDVMQAEAAAKTAVILGSETAVSWFEAAPAFEYLFIRENGETVQSAGFVNYLWNEEWSKIHSNHSI